MFTKITKITKVNAQEILDSRGKPTLEVEIIAEVFGIFGNKKIKAWSQVPSGSSVGTYEAYELRDGDPSRFNRMGVRRAVSNIKENIAPYILGMDPTKQSEIDNFLIELDGTKKKFKLGANAILGISMAVARIGAMVEKEPLYEYISSLVDKKINVPRPFFNVINGGDHAGNKLAFQEFMISPRLNDFDNNYRAGAEIYHILKKDIENKYGKEATLLGDEGGFAPNINNIEEVLDLMSNAVKKSGYEGDIDFALDVAASEFFKDGQYDLNYKGKEPQKISSDELTGLYLNLINKYPIISIEDPFNESDFKAFAKLKEKIKIKNKKIQIVGDDLTVTNPSRIRTAIEKKSCDCLLLKLNQIGTITEAIEAFRVAKSDSWKVMVSHRSGETIDDFIADFAVGIGAEQIKAGAPARGERVVKYNRLLSIFRKIYSKDALYKVEK